MTPRAARLLLLASFPLVLQTTPGAWAAASHNATIASFNYTPNDVRIAVGDTVVWRNADPTVHTVTASRGEFSSGSMRQGQVFSATFNVPGLYPYFCEPHEEMRGTVSVTGPAPSTTTTAAPTTTTTAPAIAVVGAPPPAVTTTTAATRPLPEAAIPANRNGSAAAKPIVVTGGVTGEADQPSPVLPVGAVLLLAAAVPALLRRRDISRTDALRYVAAAATAATGLLHLQLRIALDYPEPIGTLLVIEAAGAALLAVWLLARPWNNTMQLTAIGAHVAALGALAVTRTRVGLFGFHEIGWDPSPQLPLAVTIGAAAIALLSLARPSR